MIAIRESPAIDVDVAFAGLDVKDVEESRSGRASSIESNGSNVSTASQLFEGDEDKFVKLMVGVIRHDYAVRQEPGRLTSDVRPDHNIACQEYKHPRRTSRRSSVSSDCFPIKESSEDGDEAGSASPKRKETRKQTSSKERFDEAIFGACSNFAEENSGTNKENFNLTGMEETNDGRAM